MISFSVPDEDSGIRVDVVLAREARVTRTRAQRALRSGTVTVDGATVRPSYRLEPGSHMAGVVPVDEMDDPQPQDIPVTVRYSDERVLVVSKPAGLVTHPARGHPSGTLVNALLGTGQPLAASGSGRPGIVHRLDKDTSGLLVVAKDDDAKHKLEAALAAHRVGRNYLALVRGTPGPSGSIDAPIGRHNVNRTKMAVVAHGRTAVTHYRTIAALDRRSLLDVALETGRTHQIRVHLAHLGHPVLGDRTYGGMTDDARALGLERPFLHAYRLAFPHPDDGRMITVDDPLPQDLLAVLAEAGIDAGVLEGL